MSTVVWIIQILLTIMFLMAGMMKLMKSKEQMKAKMGWVEDYSQGTIKFIGLMEILGAMGLILPGIFDTLTILTPVAALGVVLIMLGAIRTHLRRKEMQMVMMNVMLLLLSAFLCAAKFGLL